MANSTSPDAVHIGRRVWFDPSVVHTPRGDFALAHTHVSTRLVITKRSYALGWALVCVFVFIWLFPLSLLFLLFRAEREERDLEITFSDGFKSHTHRVKIQSDEQLAEIMKHVAFMRSVYSSDSTVVR